jgi:DNA recombination protein Rad52
MEDDNMSMYSMAPSVGFGCNQYNDSEQDRIQQLLERKLAAEEIATRAGPKGVKLAYIETHRAIELANFVFQYNGWSSSIQNITQDYMEDKGGKFNCGLSAIIRITLKDGCYHEDIGYGTSVNSPDRGTALEKAKKEAVSDGLKRTLRLFGNGLGNSIYDQNYVKKVKSGQLHTEALDMNRNSNKRARDENDNNSRSPIKPAAFNLSNVNQPNNTNLNNNNINTGSDSTNQFPVPAPRNPTSNPTGNSPQRNSPVTNSNSTAASAPNRVNFPQPTSNSPLLSTVRPAYTPHAMKSESQDFKSNNSPAMPPTLTAPNSSISSAIPMSNHAASSLIASTAFANSTFASLTSNVATSMVSGALSSSAVPVAFSFPVVNNSNSSAPGLSYPPVLLENKEKENVAPTANSSRVKATSLLLSPPKLATAAFNYGKAAPIGNNSAPAGSNKPNNPIIAPDMNNTNALPLPPGAFNFPPVVAQ